MKGDSPKTAIATWFVADRPGEETAFPQVEGLSSSADFQNTYWRCVICFFASSLRHNPDAPHLLFTNVSSPAVDGVNLAKLLSKWGVQIIHLAITFRAPPSVAKSWGNQFYILDVIKYVAANDCSDNLILLDCDCVWTMSARRISEAISRHGCLTYTLNEEHYRLDASINGITRQEMAKALRSWAADCDIDDHAEMRNAPWIPYHGGEIFAASKKVCCDLANPIDSLWEWWRGAGSGGLGIKEEAHFLSILYAFHAYSNCTANDFIKRIWTAFSVFNAGQSDFGRAIWHLPSEKQSGFRRLFRELTGDRRESWADATAGLQSNVGALFWHPTQGPGETFFGHLSEVGEKGKTIVVAQVGLCQLSIWSLKL